MEQASNERTVAVVDDDTSVRVAIRSLLRSLGFRVETFGSAEDVIAVAGHGDVACLIVDVRLPGMSGLDLQRHLAAAGSGTPLVFITAHDDPADRRQAVAGGAPPSPAVLRTALIMRFAALGRARISLSVSRGGS
jgi:FixJ family two-component response regulator